MVSFKSGLFGAAICRLWTTDTGKAIEARRPQLEQWEDLCAELGHEPATVALAWLLTRPAVTAPIIGPRTPEQLEGALDAVEVTLDDDTLGRLDAIFPGYKTSPEAYAW